ncbi:MAG: ATP-binding protein [Betaproteobacteria bacterium]
MIKPLVRLLSQDPTAASIQDDGKQAQRVVMSQVERALVGEANSRWRTANDGSGEILSVAQPVWQGDNIVGAVVLEETASNRQSLKFAALESLLGTTIIVFLVGFVALLGFAWRLAYRVRRLQREADATTDSHGRILGRISGSASDDEIGALAHTLDETMQRLSRYNGYLEQMAARLSHELRTPVAVVRSSLDNLREGELAADAKVYVDRADEGVRRLSGLISRMAEATQLEGLLQGAEKSRFDLASVAKGCVDGHRMAYSARSDLEFIFALNTDEPISTIGSADAIAQLLDKLVQNAVDFALPGTAIRVSVTSIAARTILAVENKGPLLPADAVANLFVSMVSSRGSASATGDHLGLGLYVVRLIAEFHGGAVSARNLADGSGVRFEVYLPQVMF